MSVHPGAATTWLRVTTSVVTPIVAGAILPGALAVHAVPRDAGDAGLLVIPVLGMAVLVLLPLTAVLVPRLVRAMPRSGTVALLAGSLTLPACLTLPVLLWPLPVGAVATAAWWASGHVPALSRLLGTHGQATAARAARAARRADAGRAQ